MTTRTETAVYVYGIVPGDVAFEGEPAGVGSPPSPVRLARYQNIAALVSDVDLSSPLGTPEDLLAHEQLLDASAAVAPVLPLRFGAVVSSEDAVSTELLEPHHEEFSAALAELEGYQEYVVKGRYVQEAILREILDEDTQAAALAAQSRDADPASSREGRIELGQLISERLARKRALDTRHVADLLASQAHMSVARPTADELEAVNAAFLVRAADVDQMMAAVGELSAGWEGRVELRVIGPVAAYDFVGSTDTSPEG